MNPQWIWLKRNTCFLNCFVLQYFFCDFDKKWGVLGGAPIVATIRNPRPSQQVWRLKRSLGFNEQLWKWSIVRKCWSIFLKKLVMFSEIYRNADHQNTNTQTNKWKKQTSKQTSKRSNKQANKQTSKQTKKQITKQTSKQASKQARKQTSEQASKKHKYRYQFVAKSPVLFGPMQWM